MNNLYHGVSGTVLAILAAAPVVAQTPTPTPPPTTTEAMAAAPAQPAAAPAPAPGNGRTNYDAAYFAQYAPSTAQQIVERVPGFSIQDTDQNIRGFAGAAGNVVINGQRPSSKSDSLQTTLARIPANRVLRVEVGPGELFGAEYAGKPQVVNLILNDASGVAGTVTAGLQRDFTGALMPSGSVSALVRRGKSNFNVSATVTQERTADEGYDRVTSLPGGTELEYREKTNHYHQPNGAVTAAWEYDGGQNRTAHLNARYAADRLKLSQDNHVLPAGGPERNDLLTQRYDEDDYEIGGDVMRPFAGGGLKLIGLATRRARDYRDVSLVRTLAEQTVGGFAQNLNDRLDERLARLVWNRADLGGWQVETGGEATVNTLHSKVDLFKLGAGGVPTRIDLPVDDATVKEVRGEAFVNAGKALSKAVRLDVGLTYERSRLTVSGDASAERTLSFLKPKASLDWRPEDSKWHVQLAVQRTVAQLQFTDFISSAELSNDRVNGGNPNLLPQRAWEGRLTVEHPILGDGLVKLELGYDRIALLQDRVPTPDGLDAPGNLGNATGFLARPRIDAPLDSFGIKGGRLTLAVSYYNGRVQDPYTLKQRRFSGNSDLDVQLDFRQDRGKFAWGFSLNASTEFAFYRLNEVDALRNLPPVTSAFVEYRPDTKTTISFQVRNLLNREVHRDRHFYDPDRHTPDPFLREQRVRNQHLMPQLTVKRTFG